ncbi:cupin [Mycolicibacterium litorale]|nr:cupin [Mycolicibacterium litorale]
MAVRYVIASAVLAAGIPPGLAWATPPEGDTVREDLAKGTTEVPVSIMTDGPATLMVQELTISPGASSGWHTHPGAEYSVITEGSVELQTAAACWPVSYGAGQAVLIPAGLPHRVANESAHDARAVVTYTLPVGAPVRGDSPDICSS